MRYTKLGLCHHDKEKATPGFTVFSPILNDKKAVVVVNNEGLVVKEWALPAWPGAYGYLLENGNLFVSSQTKGGFMSPAKGGLMQEIDWDGNVVWEHRDDYQHHDFRKLPNGNAIYLAWELLPADVAKNVRGGMPGSEDKAGIWGETIREVNARGEVVWEWKYHEHIDVAKYPLAEISNRHEYPHANTISIMKDGNVMVCFRHIDVVIIIEKSSGNVIWERHEKDWGGPHDPQELDNGNILMFANRRDKFPFGSSIIEFDRNSGETVWSYWGNPSHSFNSFFISGTQRLDSGNTLICEGLWGRIFEVTPQGEVVWEYICPFVSPMPPHAPITGEGNMVFRAYRYAPDSPQIRNRL